MIVRKTVSSETIWMSGQGRVKCVKRVKQVNRVKRMKRVKRVKKGQRPEGVGRMKVRWGEVFRAREVTKEAHAAAEFSIGVGAI